MTQREQMLALEQRLEGLEVRVDMQQGELDVLSTWLLRAKTALAVVPATASVLMFLYWFVGDEANKVDPPPVVDAACASCLYDPIGDEWYCEDCVVIDGEAICFSVPVLSGSRSNVQAAGYGRLPGARAVTRRMQIAH